MVAVQVMGDFGYRYQDLGAEEGRMALDLLPLCFCLLLRAYGIRSPTNMVIVPKATQDRSVVWAGLSESIVNGGRTRRSDHMR